MSLCGQQWVPTSLQVTVLQARSLRIKGKSGTNDAYAVMQVGKEKFQTSVAEKSVAPVWKEEASFDLPPLFQGGGGGGGGSERSTERTTLHVHVLHRALVGPDKLLGQAVINLLQLSEDRTRSKTEWFKLLDKTGKPDKDRGEVLLDIQFMRNNMTSSMFDLSATGKSRSRLGKLKDKVRGKKKESDSSPGGTQTFTQILTDSEDEANGDDGEETASREGKNKKPKMKSLFSSKSNLQKTLSQSMSVLPAKTSTLSGSLSSGLNVESSQGKKKFKFKIHKRSGSSDLKDSSSGHHKQLPAEQSNLCINGSHVYCEEPPARISRINSNFSQTSSGLGSMEDVPENSPPSVDSLSTGRQFSPWTEEEEEEEPTEEENTMKDPDDSRREGDEENTFLEEERNWKREEEEEARKREEFERLAEESRKREELEKRRRDEEKRKREEEEREIRREKEEKVRKEKEREEEEKARKEEEERATREYLRLEKEREEKERARKEEEERLRREEERLEKEREEKERTRKEEEERARREEEHQRLEKEREEKERARKEEEERVRKEEEERARREEERQKLEEERRKRVERERIRREEECLRLAEEKKRLEEERRKIEEEKLQREEEERVKREEEEKVRREQEEVERRQEELLAEEKRRREKEEERAEEVRRQLAEEKQRLEEEERRREEAELVTKREEEERRERERREQEEAREEEERKEAERLKKEECERLEKEKLEEEKKRIDAEEKARKENEERIRMEEERRVEEEEKQREEEERIERAKREEAERLLAKETRREELKRWMEEEERMRKEEMKRLEEEERLKEEKMRLIEEEKARKEKEEKERLAKEEKVRKEKEEKERLAKEEKVRKEKEEKERLAKEEKVRKEKEEKERLVKEEKVRKEKEEKERLAKEEKAKKERNKKAPGKKTKLSVPADVISTNPFDEEVSTNPFEESDDDAPQHSCRSAVSPAGPKTLSAEEKNLIGSQREKRLAPQPPGRNQDEKQNQSEQNASTTHLVQINHRSPDKDVKTASVPPQRSMLMIPPLSKSPNHSKDAQISSENASNKTPTNAAKPAKRPAPSRPQPEDGGRNSSSDSKVLQNSKTKPIYGLNPFEDDEDELQNDNESTASGSDDSAFRPPPAENDAAKIKSSKVARAPPPPAKHDATASTLNSQDTDKGHRTEIAGETLPEKAADQIQTEEKHPVHVEGRSSQDDQNTKVQISAEAGVKKQVPPVAARRLQPVKPLNPVEQSPVSVVQGENDNKSAGIPSGLQDKTKVDSEKKGPYSQLTREELISLVLKQEQQLSERDKKISELELYIDNLLVKVIEEQPSILMSLNAVKKPA